MKERLKRLLEDKGMTQAEFADYIGVGRSSITHIMTGRDKSSQTVVSNTLLHFPEINPMWMLRGEGEMYRENVARTEVEHQPVADLEPEPEPVKSVSMDYQAALFPEEEMPEVAQPQETQQQPTTQQPVQQVVQPQPVYSQPQPVQQVVQPQPVYTQPQPVQQVVQPQPVYTQPQAAPVLEVKEEKEVKKEKKLKKIVFFYDDRSFEEFLPTEE